MATKKPKTVVQQHTKNFNTLKRAFASGDVALMECTLKSTGEKHATICAVQKEGEEFVFVPFAIFLNGNPFELLESPMESDERAERDAEIARDTERDNREEGNEDEGV